MYVTILDALASIIGTIASPEVDIKPKIEVEPPNVEMDNKDDAINIPQNVETVQSSCVSGVKEDMEVTEPRNSVDPVSLLVTLYVTLYYIVYYINNLVT